MDYQGSRTNLLLLSFRDHVLCKASYTLIYDFCHSHHYTLRLWPVQAFALQSLNEFVSVKMVVVSRS